MLWTIIPAEQLYTEDARPSKLPQRLINYCGVTAVAEEIDADHLRLVRLISTEPADYLASSLTPGTIISRC